MKRLTKKIKHKIYTETLVSLTKEFNKKIYSDNWHYGLCRHMKLVSDIDLPNAYHSMNKYKEVFKHKPDGKDKYDYWFNQDLEGYNKRIAILKQAIEETK